jgi:hypothetical protein
MTSHDQTSRERAIECLAEVQRRLSAGPDELAGVEVAVRVELQRLAEHLGAVPEVGERCRALRDALLRAIQRPRDPARVEALRIAVETLTASVASAVAKR